MENELLQSDDAVEKENTIKFYRYEPISDYVEYLIGKDREDFYYGKVVYIEPEKYFQTAFIMSRDLHWVKDGFPQEPKEISFEEWLTGFVKQLHENGIIIK